MVLTDPVPNVLERVEGPTRDEAFGFSIGGDVSPVAQVKQSTLQHREQPTNHTGARAIFTRYLTLFRDTKPRLSAWFSYKQIMTRTPREIGNAFQGFNSTPAEISHALKYLHNQQSPQINALAFSHRSPIIITLFSIMESDTLRILRLMRTRLKEIEHGTMDDGLLQLNLQHWRNFISTMRDFLPELQNSLSSFVSFTENPFRRSFSPEQRGSSDLPGRLKQLELEISTTLTLAVNTQKALSTNIAIIDSKRGIAEAEAVTRLTELAVRIPFSSRVCLRI
jgi:hypothetical protein